VSQRDSGYERKERDLKVCVCGKSFGRNPKHSRAQWAAVMFCSPACANKARSTHGQRNTRLYRVWAGIKTRCLNPNDPLYQEYGARGITMCPEWQADFAAFAAYMGDDPGKGFDVGRKDNDLGYQPGNVRWETETQNARNKRSTRWVTVGGKPMSLIEASEAAGLPYKRVHARLKAGWTLDKALKP
jgi:hypothetical protein